MISTEVPTWLDWPYSFIIRVSLPFLGLKASLQRTQNPTPVILFLFLLKNMANQLFFFTLLLFTAIVFISIDNSHGRYLRPSDHGLAYQNTSRSVKKDVPEMVSFFKGGRTATSFVPTTPLPEASRSSNNDPAAMWWRKNRKSREDSGKDHVRQVLLLTSLLCGLTGVVLLVVSAVVFIYRYRNRKQLLLEAKMAKQGPAESSALVLASSSGVKMKSPKLGK